jgi:hypothetical protein
MEVMSFIDSASLLLANQELLSQAKFNLCDWVAWKDTPFSYTVIWE